MGKYFKNYQIEQLTRIGALIRGDWSGTLFDGRDVLEWIEETLDGKDIRKKLAEFEDEY